MRSGISISIVVFAVTAVSVLPALAEPGDEVGRFPWEGEVSGMNVYVRSGPGANYYATTKLNAGDRVLVLAEKFGWYQIVPPPKSFSYIDMSMVERQAGAKTGKVAQDRVYVRAGSHLAPRKTSTQIVLNAGAQVEILGEMDGFYKIVPPRGAGLYISKQYVASVPPHLRIGMVERYLNPGGPSANAVRPEVLSVERPAETVAPKVEKAVSAPGGRRPAGGAADPRSVTPFQTVKTTGETPVPQFCQDELPLKVDSAIGSQQKGDAGSVKQAEDIVLVEPVLDGPSERMTGPSGRYQALLTVLESELHGLVREPSSGEQDWASLRTRYGEIAAQSEERTPARVAEIRMKQLADLIELHSKQAKTQAAAEELAAFRARMSERRMEITRRRAEAAMEKFDLEGELRQSYAFAPEKRRYRLVDPETRRTVAYVDVPPTVDVNVEYLIGRVVGIRTTSQRFSPEARVPIAVAANVTDLTPRPSPDVVINPDQASDAGNNRTEIAKSTEERRAADGGEGASRESVVAAEQDPEQDK
ncbi:MAG: hypothetical protein JXQ75_20330 [Phycisphaerae bacterium]|nr:hypothetical protein [Phycisphaerae bacterium]